MICKYERYHVPMEVVGVGSPLLQWVPRIELRLSGLLDKRFQLLSHLSGPFRHWESLLIGPVLLYVPVPGHSACESVSVAVKYGSPCFHATGCSKNLTEHGM